MNRRNFLITLILGVIGLFLFPKKSIAQKQIKIPKEKIGWYIDDELQIMMLNNDAFKNFK